MIGHDPVLVSFLRYSSDKHYTSLTFHDWTSWFVMSRHHDYHSSQLQGYHHISSGSSLKMVHHRLIMCLEGNVVDETYTEAIEVYFHDLRVHLRVHFRHSVKHSRLYSYHIH